MQKLITLFAAFAIGASGQTQLDLRTQSKGVDFSGINPTKPFQTGTVLPASCTVGQMFFKSDATSGQNLYGCVATNTWALESQGGSSGGNVTVNNTGSLVGTRGTLDFSAGLGILTSISDTGQAISIQPSVDTAVIQTRAGEQAGGALLCASASGSGVTYTCAMTPALTSYTSGMVLRWKPDVNGTGGVTTLNIDTLGAISVKLANGSNPAAGDLVAGRIQEIWYDGVNFRFLNSIVDTSVLETRAGEQSGSALLCASASGSGVSYTCAMSPALTSYTPGMALRWKPDVSGTGGFTTLNIDTLGAVAVRLANGTSNPTAGDIVAGRVQELWYDGVNFRFLNSIVDTAVLETRAGEQSGSALLCASASGSGASYTCAMNPALTTYTSGMVLRWKPDVNGTGGATTLNVNGLGAVNVRLANGASNPAAGDIVAGRIQEIWYDGVNFRFLNSIVDASALQTRAGEQSGGVLQCVSASGSGVTYTCAMTPALTSYTSGMVLRWKPDVNGIGGATTLNVDTLGAVGVKLANGTSNPVAGDLIAGRFQELWYDGSNFRFLSSITPAGVLGEARPTCNTAAAGRLWFIPGATSVKDSLSVCAKDATDAYAWRTLY